MTEGMMFVAVLWVLGLFVAVLWVLMPFAIFGTKPLLREQLAAQQRTNALLQQLIDQQKAQAAQPRAGQG